MIRIFVSVLITLAIAPAIWAQSASTSPIPAEEQSEAMIDTLKRMRIKREENEHKKVMEKGLEIKDEAHELFRNFAHHKLTTLPRSIEKKLKDLEKSARHIRSESGGSKDQPLEAPPSTLDETLKDLLEASDRMHDNLTKTSRRVVSIDVINDACEVIALLRLLRNYVK